MCDDEFDINDAEVACRQVGYPGALEVRSDFYGPGSGPIWLDNAACLGRERSLFYCAHNGVGKHNCRHSEDVGVICQGIA